MSSGRCGWRSKEKSPYGGFLQLLGMGADAAKIINAVMVWTLEWDLWLWLFRRRIFIKI